MKSKHRWKKGLRSGLCVGALALFLFQFTALAQEGEAGQEDPSKISPQLLEAFAQQPALMSVGADGPTAPAAVWITDVDLSEAKAEAAASSGLLSTAPLTATAVGVESAVSMPVSTAPTNQENPDAVQEYIEAKRLASRLLYNEQNEAFAAAHFEEEDIIYVSQYSPVILVNLTLGEAEDLTRYDQVDYLDLYESGGELQLANAVSASRADYVRDTKNYKGGGIKVGILDGHISSASGLPSNITIKPAAISNYSECMHAKRVATVIMTMAPNATYYAAYYGDYMANTEWLLSQGVNVINISATIGSNKDSYNQDAKWFDHIAFNHDVHVVIAAGNNGSGGVKGAALAYNAITVGAYNDHNSTNTAGFTVWDSSSYMTSVPDRLPSKPDLLAPGDNIYIQVDGTSGDFSGTSFAAPFVTGTVVYMCQVNSTMKIRQDAAKAALAASCFDVHYTPSEAGYQRWGNGALNSRYAWQVARAGQFRYNYTTYGQNTYTYTFSTSAASTYEFVALAYLNYAKFDSGSSHTGNPSTNYDCPPNLDLKVENVSTGAVVGTSTLGVGRNVEKVGFPTGGANTFRITITQLNDFGKNGYFGVAWY